MRKSVLETLRPLRLREGLIPLIKRFLRGPVFTFFEKFGIHVLPVHYYSPVPDTRELRRQLSQWYREWSFAGVEFNVDGQSQLLENLRTYTSECDELPAYNQVREQDLGEGYGEIDSHILHAMIRHFKPRTIIEVGSGVSTYYCLHAASLNGEVDGVESRIVCVEPYPKPALYRLRGASRIEIVPKLVQELSTDFFQALEEGDILFIDSTHIVKINSDVVYLYLEVLPSLKEGVVVHIHDIPFPYPAPDPELWIFTRHQFWTESALVHAFLMYNNRFKILLCSSYLHYREPDKLKSVFSVYDPGKPFPASLWLQKQE